MMILGDAAWLAIAAVANLISKIIDGQPPEFQRKQWERFDRFLSQFDPPPTRRPKRKRRRKGPVKR